VTTASARTKLDMESLLTSLAIRPFLSGLQEPQVTWAVSGFFTQTRCTDITVAAHTLEKVDSMEPAVPFIPGFDG
jgi:hypothetical protein